MIHNPNRFGGPCWSRDRGYHHPAPLPAHIMRIITQPAQTIETRSAKTEGLGPKDESVVGSADAPKASSPNPRDDGEK